MHSETYYPGWDVWLDGKPIPIHQADIALRAVAIPDGTHRVRMEFRPTILVRSLMLSLATVLGMCPWRVSNRSRPVSNGITTPGPHLEPVARSESSIRRY